MKKHPLKVLFITRAYPPIIGGMEKLSYNLTTSISRRIEKSYIVANRRGRYFLPLFALSAIFKGLFWAPKVDLIHLSDPTLAIVGFFIKIFYRKKPIAVTLHGLDITYQDSPKQKDLKKRSLFEKIFNHKVYRFYLKKFLRADLFICISEATCREAIKKGLKNTVVVPVGVSQWEYFLEKKPSLAKLAAVLNVKTDFLKDKNILVTVGRLVKRKGVRWFVLNVMPKLSENYIYLVIGRGIEKERIKEAIYEKGFQDRVFLLGALSEDELKIVYNTAHLFVMPNIKIKGDFEGFGMVALEASSAALPVLASNIEGIPDAVHNEKNGFLVRSGDATSFHLAIKGLFEDKTRLKEFGKEAREYTVKNFSWDRVALLYVEAFKKLIEESKR